MSFKPGLCCISLSNPNKFQTMTKKSFLSKPKAESESKLLDKINNNCKVTSENIKLCIQNGWCYRLSSDVCPLMTLPEANLDRNKILDLDEFKILASMEKCRISNHPDQFNVLASENESAVESTIRELNFQSWFMDCLNLPASHLAPINIHLNCSSGDPDIIASRFWKNYNKLDINAQKRLVLETEDKGIWNAEKLVKYISEPYKIPITFDYLHHKCNPGNLKEQEAFEVCYSTWGDTTPLFHYAESQPNQNNPRKHAEWATSVPDTYGKSLDIDFEFKMKDLAILKIVGIKNDKI